MNLAEAVTSFDNWSAPGTFERDVSEKLDSNPEDKKKFEAMFAEASRAEYWQHVDLIFGCKIAHNTIREKFPGTDDHVIGLLVRAASYPWR